VGGVTDYADNDKMVIATPFDKPNQFYLNCKENFFGVRGHARIGDMRVDMGERDTAVMDWGRGVWPFSQLGAQTHQTGRCGVYKLSGIS